MNLSRRFRLHRASRRFSPLSLLASRGCTRGAGSTKLTRGEVALCALGLIVLLFAACTPAQTPALLGSTPGAAVVVTEDTYRSDLFTVRYPAGWRVITSQAGDPPTVTFVSPDNCALIVVSTSPITEPPESNACTDQDVQSTVRNLTLGSVHLTVVGSAPTSQFDAFLTHFEQVAASLESAP